MKNIVLSERILLEDCEKIFAEHRVPTECSAGLVYEKSEFDALHWTKLEAKVNAFSAKFSKDLFDEFNKFNSCRKSTRFWEIVALNWVIRVVRVLYYRYDLIKDISKTYPNSLFHIEETDISVLNTDLSADIFAKCEMETWNSAVYKFILDALGLKYQVHQCGIEEGKNHCFEGKSHKLNLIKWLFNCLNYFNRGYILSTYLPKNYEIILNLLNFQFPTFETTDRLYTFNKTHDIEKRKLIIGKSIKPNLRFNQVFSSIIPYLVPSIFLENFEHNRDKIIAKTYPKSPKFIFTSNAYDNNDQFKIYTAEKVEKGTKYFVGQHGNFFNTPLLEASFDVPELKYSDKYLTWGSPIKNEKMITAFPFTLYGKKVNKKKTLTLVRSAIIIMDPLKLNRFTWDVSREYNDYLQDLLNFHEYTKSIDIKFILRPHNSFWGNLDLINWTKENLSNFFIEKPNKNRSFFEDEDTVYIFTYDSTGITEALAMGMPVAAFWNTKYHILYKDLLPLYDRLYENKIFFQNSSDLAQFLKKQAGKVYELSPAQLECVSEFLSYNGSCNNMSLKRLNRIINCEL
jgi:putative transferase (TIGR04331 family)